MKYLVGIMKLIPKNILSFILGLTTRIRWPEPLSTLFNQIFVTVFSINMSESEKTAAEYKTIEDVFTRNLKPGARTIESDLVSPADGFLAVSQATRGDRAIQAKGLFYSAEELIYGPSGPVSAADKTFDPAWATTIYLAPHNYHRVHSPVSGRLLEVVYHPGLLWPVNNPFVRIVPNMFAVNERLVFKIEWKPGVHVYAVMVGALNVGRIMTLFSPLFVSNSAKRQLGLGSKQLTLINNTDLAAGDEIGTFMLGSTVVLVFDRKYVEANPVVSAFANEPIKMGRCLKAGPS